MCATWAWQDAPGGYCAKLCGGMLRLLCGTVLHNVLLRHAVRCCDPRAVLAAHLLVALAQGDCLGGDEAGQLAGVSILHGRSEREDPAGGAAEASGVGLVHWVGGGNALAGCLCLNIDAHATGERSLVRGLPILSHDGIVKEDVIVVDGEQLVVGFLSGMCPSRSRGESGTGGFQACHTFSAAKSCGQRVLYCTRGREWACTL
jgi:hypothetical protein